MTCVTLHPAALPDACPDPDCHPGDNPASLPLEINGDGSALYECPRGHRWRTRRDEYGWPVAREPVDPASPREDVSRHPTTRNEQAA